MMHPEVSSPLVTLISASKSQVTFNGKAKVKVALRLIHFQEILSFIYIFKCVVRVKDILNLGHCFLLIQ